MKKIGTFGNVHYLICHKKKEDNKMNREDSSKKLEILAEIENAIAIAIAIAIANTTTARNRISRYD